MVDLDPNSDFSTHLRRLLTTVKDEELVKVLRENQALIVSLGQSGGSTQDERKPVWEALEILIEERAERAGDDE